MQGSTVEHATVVAAPRALTRGWSYTALSRARGATELHIDGSPVTPAALERSQIAPHDDQRAPGSAEVVQRAAAQMKVRDDEDLAIRQLPTRLGPGASMTPSSRPTAAGPDRGDPSALPQPTSLRDPRAALDDVAAQRARLLLRELDAVDVEILQVSAQRDQAAGRLAGLPAPRLRLARHGDAHAAERARLYAAVESADHQLVALRSHSARLTGVTGGLPEARAERDALERRQAQLEGDASAVRDQLAELQVANSPAWATTALGERPDDPHGAQEWDRGVRAIARQRIEHDLSDDVEALGPEPDDSGARSSWREARATVRQVQYRLGRAVERGRGLDRGRDR